MNQHSLDEESGSAYELSSDIDQASSPVENAPILSRANSKLGRGRNANTNARRSRPDKSRSVSIASSLDAQTILEDASEWALKFQAPEAPGDIRSPTRSLRRKRKAKSTSVLRAKRLKGFYNDEYRGLLNSEIQDVGARTIEKDQIPLDTSQIGSSIWTPKEKYDFFSAVSRGGRDNVPGIALRVKTKSELQIQEYIHALQRTVHEKFVADGKKQQSIATTDQPAALELSEECCSVLERAADALAMRQELYEQQKEEIKWGDTWLLTGDICKRIENQKKSKAGEEEIEESLPAANFFNLSNWLVLSHRIFMNAGTPREECNWEVLAEAGETPAVRATAFEDFHSLAISITKRLISTTLFCTTSRLRATNAKKIKHAEVNKDDVQAAVKMLGLSNDSDEFWRRCPRRCHLDVFDNDNESGTGEDVDIMQYDEVEIALGGQMKARSRARSQSTTRSEILERPFSDGDQDRVDSEDYTQPSDSSSESDATIFYEPSLLSEDVESEFEDHESRGFTHLHTRRQESRKKRIEEERASKRAQEEYLNAFDNVASLQEEQRLWTLLHQTPPFDIKSEPVEVAERPKAGKEEFGELDWRYSLEYWSQWETLPTPVTAEDFLRCRKGGTQKERRSNYRETSLSDNTRLAESVDEEGGDSLDGMGEDSNEIVQSNDHTRLDEVDISMMEIPDEIPEVNSDQSTRPVDISGFDEDIDIKSEPEE